eukprot:CAMPEP_0170752206 /NCGR_PEP_ID=MMETSP0437-20130122/11849_1 /TAXON_ID=0 /ORGANISM="Sexangularia sp." /LENGTH=1243 /DNA_ID=CAMNT_0011091269 /DNA_START=39 /DNA_END=3769 /DNA_ORIENTATION=-
MTIHDTIRALLRLDLHGSTTSSRSDVGTAPDDIFLLTLPGAPVPSSQPSTASPQFTFDLIPPSLLHLADPALLPGGTTGTVPGPPPTTLTVAHVDDALLRRLGALKSAIDQVLYLAGTVSRINAFAATDDDDAGAADACRAATLRAVKKCIRAIPLAAEPTSVAAVGHHAVAASHAAHFVCEPMAFELCVLGKEDDAAELLVCLMRGANARLLASVERDLQARTHEAAVLGVRRLLLSAQSAETWLPHFANLLEDEATNRAGSGDWTGRLFQVQSVLGPLLSVSLVPSVGVPRAKALFSAGGLTSPNTTRRTVDALADQLRSTLRPAHELVHDLLRRVLKDKARRATVVSWLSAALRLNTVRATLNTNDPLYMEMEMCAATAGFAFSLTNVVFHLCRPLFPTGKYASVDAGYPAASDALGLVQVCVIDAGYPAASDALGLAPLPKLAEAPGDGEAADEAGAVDDSPDFSFVTEIFFLSFHALHIGLAPALRRVESTEQTTHRALRELQQLAASGRTAESGDPMAARLTSHYSMHQEMLENLNVHIGDGQTLSDIIGFCWMALRWLQCTLGDATPAAPREPSLRRLFATFPEYFVQDLYFVLQHLCTRRIDSLAAEPDAVGLALCVAAVEVGTSLLSARELVRAPLVRNEIAVCVDLLLYAAKFGQSAHGGGGGISFDRNFRDALLHELRNNTTSAESLIPALMDVYVDIGVVEALTFDMVSFDLYGSRSRINELIVDMWTNGANRFRMAARAFIQAHPAATGHFLETVLNDEHHLLEDALGRLRDVRSVQLAMDDEIAWQAQDPEVIRERESFLRSQENAARGFMRLAISALDLLYNYAADVPETFTDNPRVLSKLASMVVHYLDRLCGPHAKELKVRNMERYGFDPRGLLGKLASLICCVSTNPSFTAAVFDDFDFTLSTLEKALQIVGREHLLAPEKDELFVSFVMAAREAVAASAPAHTSTSSSSSSSSSSSMVAAMDFGPDGVAVDEDEYVSAMEELRFDEAELVATHHYSTAASKTSVAASSRKMQRIMQEAEALADSLPVTVGSSTFVRCDEDRMDLMSAMIVGPEGTPYSGGLFEFHIFLPSDYPNVPPLVSIETTGNGTVRFNPNLYNDGKVCLSILGTWHGAGDVGSKWNAASSTVLQVLVSICGLIMVEQPYFNEPGYERERGTSEGERHSFEYNEDLRLSTIRFAMVGHLRKPPVGFEDVVRTHFRLQKNRLLAQCASWAAEATPRYKAKMD